MKGGTLSSWDEIWPKCTPDQAGWATREWLGWVWAAFEAERGWNSYDGYLVERSKKHGLSEEEVGDFSYYYQVSRTVEENSYGKIADISNKMLRCNISSLGYVADIYNSFLSEISVFGAMNKKTMSRRVPWVFAAKLLWFYQPEIWVMYDNLSQRSLREFLPHGKKFTARNDFQTAVRTVFTEEMVDAVAKLAKKLGINYKYPFRIIDKYLYLRGGSLRYGGYWVSKTQWMLERLDVKVAADDVMTIARPLLFSMRS